jgi:hypothetical protein
VKGVVCASLCVEASEKTLQDIEVHARRRCLHRALVPRTAVRARPLESGKVPVLCCHCARYLVPRAAVRASPLQKLELSNAHRRHRARFLVPWTAVRARQLQQLEVRAKCRRRARLLVPRAAVRARPPQHREVSTLRRFLARPLVPRAAVRAQPLQHMEVSALRRFLAGAHTPTRALGRAVRVLFSRFTREVPCSWYEAGPARRCSPYAYDPTPHVVCRCAARRTTLESIDFAQGRARIAYAVTRIVP